MKKTNKTPAKFGIFVFFFFRFVKNIRQTINPFINQNYYGMKKTIFYSIISFTLMLMSFSCDKITTEADYPGVSLYLTKGDYYNLITVGVKDGKIVRGPYTGLRYIVVDGDTVNLKRARLTSNYVLDSEGNSRNDAFLNITFKEYLSKYNGLYIPQDTIWKYMLDLDPYTEFWRAKDNEAFQNRTEISVLDTTGLNQIILEGRIEEYVTRLK